jgi:hypothetical protein
MPRTIRRGALALAALTASDDTGTTVDVGVAVVEVSAA